jgi:hypothetical protein
MLFLATLGSAAPNPLTPRSYDRRTAASFSQLLWDVTSGNSTGHVNLTQYLAQNVTLLNSTYVVRDKGDKITIGTSKYYYVYGTPEEIAALNATLKPIYRNSTVFPIVAPSDTNVFVILKVEASNSQTMLFWVNIVVWILFLGFVISAITLWHSDNYAKDPANSLLFVTDGNRLVTGE